MKIFKRKPKRINLARIPIEDQVLMAQQFQLLQEIRAERETHKKKDG